MLDEILSVVQKQSSSLSQNFHVYVWLILILIFDPLTLKMSSLSRGLGFE